MTGLIIAASRLKLRRFDLDTLVECDDEYWDTGDPETNMQQPKGKPSYVAFFNCYARLMEIYSYAMRMLYYTRKPSMYNNKATPTQVILKLDSACNAWLDSIPTHCKSWYFLLGYRGS